SHHFLPLPLSSHSLLLPLYLSLLTPPPPPRSPLFPYTTLFRSRLRAGVLRVEAWLAAPSAGVARLARRGGVLLAHGLADVQASRSEEHTSELQSRVDLVCRLLLEKKKKSNNGQDERILSENRTD